jgi:putative ABC transport system permease protein
MASTFDLGRQFEQRTAASVFGTLGDSRDLFGVQSVHLLAANLSPGVDKRQVIAQLRLTLGDRGVNLADVRQLKHDIQQSFHRLLLVASTVAWAAMAVASLGVTNTIMASIRTRRWQFGVLRSIGVTRSLLLRMVLGEAILLGLVATALGLGAGLLMAFNARQLSRLVMGFEPPLAIPWPIIAIGVGVVMLISVLASLLPAISVARADPLSLLQAGRASA